MQPLVLTRCGIAYFHQGVGGLHVQVADGIPLGLLEPGQPGAVVGAGVVDEHVQTAPLGNDLFVQFLNGLVVAQVDGLGHDLVVGVDLLEGQRFALRKDKNHV